MSQCNNDFNNLELVMFCQFQYFINVCLPSEIVQVRLFITYVAAVTVPIFVITL